MSVSKAQVDATARYSRKTYDQTVIFMRKDAELSREVLKAHAASKNESLNEFIKRAIEETIQCDKERARYNGN